MPVHIPDNILNDILSRVDIVELIGSYFPLKRAGRNFKANCPFHHEKTPSFMVSSERQIYHCFGCGESGNAFKFLMRHERMEFPEAVEFLAAKSGIALPKAQKDSSMTEGLFASLYKVNDLAASFYADNLNSQKHKAKDYLLTRGLRDESIKLFSLGYAPDKWDALISHLRGKNISISLIEKAGLILTKDNSGYYDRFRNRIMIPIFDGRSRILGFGARVLDNSLPKYINSPETPVYIKGRNLYGLNFAKDAIRENDYAVIVEGYLDFIIPFQEGLKNIVASSGTALTIEQIRLLKRYTHNIIMVYDGDSAGEMATLRALDMFIEEGVNVKVVSLPLGLDPDSFVRKNGIAVFKQKINQADKLFDYKLKVLKSQYNVKEIENKARICSEMLITINKFSDAVSRSEYIKRLSEELDVQEPALLQDLMKIKEKKQSTGLGYDQPKPKKILNISPVEKLLIKLMLEEKELAAYIRQHLEPADFQDKRTSQIVSTVFSLTEKGKDINKGILMNHLPDQDTGQLICETAFMPEVSSEQKEKIVNDCIHRLKTERLRLKKEDLHSRIKTAQAQNNKDELNSLLEEFHLLIKKDR